MQVEVTMNERGSLVSVRDGTGRRLLGQLHWSSAESEYVGILYDSVS